MKSYVSIALLALAFLLLGSRPASAQSGWVLDHYECTGKLILDGVTTPWPSSTTPVYFYIPHCNTSVQCTGTVQAIFVWKGMPPAPSILNVQLTSLAAAYGSAPCPMMVFMTRC